MFALTDGRLIVMTYSQFLGSRFDKRGASWGTYKGYRYDVETEGHYPTMEACRAYFSDDNGRHWVPCDGWIMGWRDQRWTDDITEPCALQLRNGDILMMARALTGRLHAAQSEDRGQSWWPGARPTLLASSYSPCRLGRLPDTGDLLVIWNQVSRIEIRKGLRRCRLSTAVSKDDGRTWEHFKNLEVIPSMAGTSRVQPDLNLEPVLGDDNVGELADDFELYHYPNLSFVGQEAFISIPASKVKVETDIEGVPSVKDVSTTRTRILPVSWFYKG